MNKYIGLLWSSRAQFVKYFFVGTSTFVVDMSTLIAFKEVLGFVPVAAVALNQLLSLAYNFTLNKYWSFGSSKLSAS